MTDPVFVDPNDGYWDQWDQLGVLGWTQKFSGGVFSCRLEHQKRGWAEGRWGDSGTAAKLATEVFAGLVSGKPFRVENPAWVSWEWSRDHE
jgi:hypothetical protein